MQSRSKIAPCAVRCGGVSLKDIWRRNDKQLLSNFSELTANEYTRNFVYSCYLKPKECAAVFSSFGSEGKARNEMKRHLFEHLHQLMEKSRCELSSFLHSLLAPEPC